MAEPGKETAATPPPLPQEPETTDGPAAAAEPTPHEGEPAVPAPQVPVAVAEPTKETTTPTPTGPEAETTGALAPEPSLQKLPDADQPQQTMKEADGQPPMPTKAGEVAELPRPAETQAQGNAAPAAPTPHEAPQKQEEKPARRRWRRLQAVVSVVFRHFRSASPRGDQSSQPPEDKMGETKPSAPEGQQLASPEEKKQHAKDRAGGFPAVPDGKERGEGEMKASAPDGKEPPKKKEGGAPGQASSVQEKEMDAAQERAQEREGKAARRRWRRLRAAVRLLFIRPESVPGRGDQSTLVPKDKEGETETPVSGLEEKKPPAPAEMALPKKDSTGRAPEAAVQRDEAGEKKSSVPDGKKLASGQQEQKPAAAKKPSRKDSAGEGEDERSKDRRDETQAGTGSALVKRLQKAGRRVLHLLSWYNRHRASAPKEGGEMEGMDEDKADVTKPLPDGKQPSSVPVPEKDKPHWKWAQEEGRLEHILEEAFTRLLATEYKQLDGVRQKCLLTFSVFELASEVKRQVMIYWWVAEFDLRHQSGPAKSTPHAAPQSPEARKRKTMGRVKAAFVCQQRRRARNGTAAPAGGSKADRDDAQDVFSKLADDGFLVPIKNWCSKVIHGCQVNPLVHWMVKRQARGDNFADLDAKGRPDDFKSNSSILCLTAGNRAALQKMRMEDESLVGKKQEPAKDASKVENNPKAIDEAHSQKDSDQEATQLKPGAPIELFKRKRVILNINAHVYPVTRSIFLHLAECLVVLQLGRWHNVDDDKYMEVNGLESLHAIGFLKNLRYLGLRGLSRLMELPIGIQYLKKLGILDMSGCQNLVKVEAKIITKLKQLTHLDLTECYMLEHIDRGITSLSELQVFKGFVFAIGTQGNNACRLQDLKRLRKLQKLTISVTTDANVEKNEMAELQHLTMLRKLTITWSEIPSILEGNLEKVKRKRDELLEKWTNFELPVGLVKLDIRCYPNKDLKLKVHKNLQKLYLRGGDLERFSIIDESKSINSINTLRLRYLKKFNMEWKDILSILKYVEHVEVMAEYEKLGKDKKGIAEKWNLGNMKIPDFTLDEHGVWMKDKKEEENISTNNEVQGATKKVKVMEAPGSTEDSSTEVASTITSVSKKDDNDVSKEQASEGKEEQVATPKATTGQTNS